MADEAVMWNALSAIGGGFIGAVGAWIAKRAEKAPDMQATLTAAIADVVKHYQAALDRSDGEASALRTDVAELRRLVEDQSAKIEDQSSKIDDQRAEIEGLVTHIGQLEEAIIAMGGKPPARRRRKCEAGNDT